MMIYQATKDNFIREFLIEPGLMSVAAIVVLGLAVFRALKMKTDWAARISMLVFAVMVSGTFLSIQVHLLSRGVYLPSEREEDAICVTGRVEAAERDKLSPRLVLTYSDDRGYSYASNVRIDGEAYYCLTDSDLSVGDLVEILYLPRSKIILRCSRPEKGR